MPRPTLMSEAGGKIAYSEQRLLSIRSPSISMLPEPTVESSLLSPPLTGNPAAHEQSI